MLDSTETPRREGLRTIRKKHTRDHLISMARKLFGKNGVEETTIGDISFAAGTSRATFYNHFTSKETFISALWQDLWLDLCVLNTKLGQTALWSRPALTDWMRQVNSAWRAHTHSLGSALSHPTAHFYSTLTAGLHNEVEKLVVSRQWDGFTLDEARRRCYLLQLQLHQSMESLHCKAWSVESDTLIESLVDIWLQTCAYDPARVFAEV